MKRIKFEIYHNLLYFYNISDEAFDEHTEFGKAIPVSFKNKERLANSAWDILSEITEQQDSFECWLSDIEVDHDLSYIPKSHPVFVKIEDIETNAEEIFEINFESQKEEDSSLMLSPAQKRSFPFDVESNNFFIEYQKVFGKVCIENEDFDISKLQVKEFFHKFWNEDAVSLIYNGVDLLENFEIESFKDPRYFLGRINKFKGMSDPL